MEKRRSRVYWLFLLLALFTFLTNCATAPTTPAQSGTEEVRLNVNRLFGYGSGNQIKGSFRLRVIGISDISSVDYLIDGQFIATVDTAPYQLDIQTVNYSFGMHTLSAIITTTDGRTIETPDRQFEFATVQQEQEAVVDVLVPLGSLILIAVALGLGLQFLFVKRKRREFIPLGTSRNYGWSGGTICPKCKRPTVLHPFSPHFGVRLKFDFCENCGKWSMMKTLSESELRLAEAEECLAAKKVQATPKTEEEKLKEILDESKYSK